MRLGFARKFDSWAGSPLGLMLRLLHGLMPHRTVQRDFLKTPPERILVIKCLGFGSILQMGPMLAALREAYPRAEITLLTFAQNASLARMLPAVNDVRAVEFRQGLVRFVFETLHNIASLRRRRFDVIVDCEFFSYYAALTALLVRPPGAETLGFYNNWRNKDWIFTHRIAIDLSNHVSEQFCKLLKPLDTPIRQSRLAEGALVPDPDAEKNVDALLNMVNVDNVPLSWVTVNANASDLCLNRRWPREYFRKLIELVTAHYGPEIRIALVGGAEDVAYVAELASGLDERRVHNLAGRLTIPELASLLRRTALFIANDSGPLHLAVACGTRTISFYGPETPKLYGPPEGPLHRVFYAHAHCSPCLNIFFHKESRCTDNVCLQCITPEEVFAAVREILALPEAGASPAPPPGVSTAP